MRYRPLHLALLLFQVVWLNAVLPGHTRGIVTLEGMGGCDAAAVDSSAAKHACCPPSKAHRSSSESKSAPAKRTAHCAVCAFAARVTPPPAIDLTPARLGMSELLPPPAPRSAEAAQSFLPYDGRGPPAAC